MDSRKAGMIAFAVIAFIVAAGVIFWTVKSQQVEVVKTVNGGKGTNPKIQAMKGQMDANGGGRDPNAVGDK